MNLGDDFALPLRAERLRWNDIAIMRTPVADADTGEFADHIFEGDRPPCRGIKQSLALIRCSPLWAADKVLRRVSGL